MPPSTARRLGLLALAATAALTFAVPATPAAASAEQVSIMQDDDLLLYRSPATQAATLRRMRALGADVVRVTVLWSVAAECARITKGRCKGVQTKARAKSFRGENPGSYPPGNWDRYDRLVRAAKDIGISVLFNPTGPGPRFAHEKAPSRRLQKTYQPRVSQFAKFVAALGARYSGQYRDENDNGGILPRVSFWSIWNEPNQPGWLTPQTGRTKGAKGIYPVAARRYRELYVAARKALVATTHGSDVILLGELAPIGKPKRDEALPLSPKEFIREVFCVDANLNPYSGPAADVRGCKTFNNNPGLIQTSGIAHHPYAKKAGPTQRDGQNSSVTMANLNDLIFIVDQIAAKTGRVKSGLPLFLTEYGYETNPPDAKSGIALAQQAFNLNLADYIAFLNPRVASTSQFLLTDKPPNRKLLKKANKQRSKSKKARLLAKVFFDFDTGLFMNDRKTPKPAAFAYAFPIFARPIKGPPEGINKMAIWGQLRYRDPVTDPEPDRVRVQFKANGAPSFQTIGDPITISVPRGFFEITVPAPTTPGSFRAILNSRFIPPTTPGPGIGITREVGYAPF